MILPYSLELQHKASLDDSKPPLLFLHGIFMGAWCWENYLPWFAKRGYSSWALSFRGHGQSEGRDNIHQFSLSHYVEDAQWAIGQIIQETGRQPIVIGHSMGGLVLQRLMTQTHLKGAVLMCAVPPQGLIPLAMGGLYHHPFITATMGKTYAFNQALPPHLFQDVLFHQPHDLTTLQRYADKMTSESYGLMMDLVIGSPFAPWFKKNCPVAIIGAKKDALVAPEVVSLTAFSYNRPIHWINEAGHAAMLESDWQSSAQVLMNAIEDL